jgi:hypothetical protein
MALLCALALATGLRASDLPDWPDVAGSRAWDLPDSGPLPPSSRQRIRLFRFAPGFLSDPVGLQDQDDSPPGVASPLTPLVQDTADNGPDWVQVAMGADNPYFDFRLPGDPGGIGFNRVVTQVQLLNTSRTACTLDLQAVTPAGLQSFGVQDGPTVVIPSLGIFQALSDDTALHGFIGKNMPLQGSLPTMPIRRNMRCGLALQRSLLPEGPEALRNLYFFMGALGEYHRADPLAPGTTAMNWQVMPGLHWKLTDSWWMSGGLMLPARANLPEGQVPWQFTCAFQF